MGGRALADSFVIQMTLSETKRTVSNYNTVVFRNYKLSGSRRQHLMRQLYHWC